jgi:hypothetical protein
MPNASHSFKRLVLGLQPSAPDRTMQLAVELAGLLRLDLLGLFLEDTSVRDLASIPFAREFRALGGGWQPIDLDRLSHDLELAARSLERMFTQAAKRLPTRTQFEVVRGPMAESIAAISRTDDIVMIMEPVSPAERVTQQFFWLTEAAFRSAAAVMLVPPQIVRSTGPIVAIAAAPDDPCIAAAAAIAIAAKEELVIIEADHNEANDAYVRKLAADTGLTIEQVAAVKGSLPDAAACVQAFRLLRERLVVMSRGAFNDTAALAIASARKVPVLVIEPPKLMADEPVPQTKTAAD